MALDPSNNSNLERQALKGLTVALKIQDMMTKEPNQNSRTRNGKTQKFSIAYRNTRFVKIVAEPRHNCVCSSEKRSLT